MKLCFLVRRAWSIIGTIFEVELHEISEVLSNLHPEQLKLSLIRFRVIFGNSIYRFGSIIRFKKFVFNEVLP